MCCFELIGIVVTLLLAAKVLYNLWQFAYTTFLGAALGANIDLRACGPWAVVTGATDGIGKAFAFKMASKGLDVVLVSRSPEKLRNVSQDIEKMYTSVRTKTIAVDFTDADTTYTKLRSQLAGMDIGILVNNVGMVSPTEYFNENVDNDKCCRDLINCNIMSVARTTDIVLPAMISRKKGVIINVASIAGALPTPLLTVYGATKAFVDKFSRELALECEKHGVVIQAVLPGLVVTNMTAGMRRSLLAPLPREFVDAAVRTLGLEKRTAGYWGHKLQLYWFELASFFARGITGRQSLKYMEVLRKKALRRQEKISKKQ